MSNGQTPFCVCSGTGSAGPLSNQANRTAHAPGEDGMAKIAKTGDRKKAMDTTKSTDCPKCSKPTRVVKRVKDRERNTPGGMYISCSACDFFERL